ncbi:MAG TPA: alpha-galactosidase, partial [Gemmatimonadaceae bacterium]
MPTAYRRHLVVLAALLLGAGAPAPASGQGGIPSPDDGGPPNGPLAADVRGGRLTLVYGGRTILDAGITGGQPELRTLVDTTDGAVTQVLKWTVRDGGRLTISGTLRGSGEAFACEVDPRPDAPPLVRNSVGPSDSRLNRAVYDRHGDWVLSVDVPAGVRVTPVPGSPDSTAFHLEATGTEIALRFRPRFFQRHRGLRYYRPWTYRVWDRSVAGWTSWFAVLDDVTEADVKRTADVMADVLEPFGYEYLQIDDGYERSPIGPPRDWLQTNAKFPSGLAALRRYIADRGLQPALWTNVSFQDSAYAFAHAAEFVRRPDGAPAYANWVGYVMDGSNPATIHDLVRPVYDSLARMGWKYVKLDALRHLRYEGYNSHVGFFRGRRLDRAAVFRGMVQSVRDAIGRGTFLLACWGIRPELAGIADAVRVGTDGFGYGG